MNQYLSMLKRMSGRDAAVIQGLAAPIVVLMVLMMMVLPLPPLVLDIFFTFNIALALMIMMVSATMLRPLDFAAFPAVLLLSTLLLSYLMVSTVKYPNFKKIGIPKSAIWATPIVVIAAVVLAIKFPEHLSKMIFVPLVLYALYGLKKNVDRRLPKRSRKRGKAQENTDESVQSEKPA